MGERLLLIGFDSATPRQLQAWAQAGHLPVLRSLLDRGHAVDVISPAGAGHVEIWASLFSGTNLGRHGVFEQSQLERGSYDYFRTTMDRDFKGRPFWCALDDVGLRSFIFDAVRAPLTPDIRGVQIADWLSHVPFDPPRSAPPQLIQRLLDEHGSDPLQRNVDAYVLAGVTDSDLLAALLRRLTTKTAVAVDFLRRDDWDFATVCFSESHCAGHHFGPATDAAGAPLLELYRALDAALAEILAAAGDGVTTVIAAGPGMGPPHTGNRVLDRVLIRLDQPRLRYFWTALRRAPPPRLRRWFATQHNAHAGAVRINLIGREPHGRVEPADYDRVVGELCEALAELRSVGTGRDVVDEVVVTRSRYSGPCLEDLPDLLVVWKRIPDLDAGVASPRVGAVRPTWGLPRGGDHNGEMALFVDSRRASGAPPSIHILDVAPSLCAHFGIDLPGSDGRAIPIT